MHSRKTICVALALAVIFIAAWFFFLPYPFSMYMDARKAAAYSQIWPMAVSDYLAAKKLGQRELHFYEVIQRVRVVSATRVEFSSRERWSGPVAASGPGFVVEKTSGKWSIVETSF